MSSYAHDAEVLVFNYQTRATESAGLAGLSVGGIGADPLATEQVSLREAIVSITTSKTKANPQGTFVITLKPTKEWTKVIVPGSWCAIFMSDQPLTESDLTNSAKQDEVGNVLSPLKMIGLIMAVRVQKQVDGNGAVSLTYTITGYDFGYVFMSSIYINHTFQPFVGQGLVKGPLADLSFPKDAEYYGDPAVNVSRVLKAWSTMSSGGLVGNLAAGQSPPSIRMTLPDGIADFMGTGTDILQFVNTAIGVDKRSAKVVTPGSDGESPDFKFKLLGQKFFMVWQLILNNTLWGMINQYLNPLLNEAYCDLHAVKPSSAGGLSGIGLASASIKPMLIVRQIPFNTPSYKPLFTSIATESGNPTAPYEVTYFTDLPKTILPKEKVLGYDIGYSDYDRVNFVEINGFDIDIAKNSPGAFNTVNRPRFEEGAIKRFGLKPKVVFGADYGVVRGNVMETGLWSPLLMDWWFNCNRYANGTIECIGLMEHIAVGENIQLTDEKILGHIESYTHTFTVDSETGNRTFRTAIDFSRGISSDSTSTKFKYVYGDETFGGTASIASAVTGLTTGQEKSIFEDDVDQRVTYTELKKKPGGGGPLGGLL